MGNTVIGRLFVLTGLFLISSQSFAQEDATATTTGPTTGTTDSTTLKLEALEQRLAEQERIIKELMQNDEVASERLAAAEQSRQEMAQELESTREELEAVTMMGLEESVETTSFFIYGFFDVSFFKQWFVRDNSVLQTQDAPRSTFLMNNINVYLKSEMTPSFDVLLETRLTFQPLGEETNLPIDAYVGSVLYPDLVDDTEYERIDTTVDSYISDETYRHGSIDIVRAYVDWKLRDWFNFRAGRYLTPFGIWNEEHASTVLVGVYYPSLMNWRMVPPSQMGIQLYGAMFPGDYLNLSYAITLSNGRGPIDTVMDLDENKAVGIRLQQELRKGDFILCTGQYGYLGKYSDVSRRAEVYLNQNLMTVEKDGSAIGGAIQVEEEYDEKIITFDLTLQLKGLKLFGEYVFRRVDYVVPTFEQTEYQFVQNGDIAVRRIGSYVAHSAYGILAWTLPLDNYIYPVLITPYAGYDWALPIDYYDWINQKVIRAGLNVKPNAYVVLKVEGVRAMYHDRIGGHVNRLTAQVAVSF